MHIDIITLFPSAFESYLNSSILHRAIDKGKIQIHLHNLRDHATNKYKQVDDYPYGGGAGMVMQIEPIYRCIQALKRKRSYDEVIYFSPDGEKLNQANCNQLSLKQNLLLLCGHYKGIDHRVREHLISREISVGDYVLSGGELPAMILCDAVARLLPGVLGDACSAMNDSFQDGLVAPAIYTRPKEFMGWKVPEVLFSGHERKIQAWEEESALSRTQEKRPDLLQ